jgi:hypothetical protein
MEGSLVAYKVFTNGSTLQASEVNENLMQQAVATFSNAAARTAAITSPVEGQLTYLLDVDRYDHWNGSAWVSPFGETLLSSVTFSAQSAVSLSNVFNSTYENYRLVINIDTVSTNMDLLYRLRSASTDNTSPTYFTTGTLTLQTSASVGVTNVNAGTSGYLTAIANGVNGSGQMMLYQPNLAVRTRVTHQFAAEFGDFRHNVGGSLFNATNVFDGITIFPTAGTIGGKIRLFGVRNS